MAARLGIFKKAGVLDRPLVDALPWATQPLPLLHPVPPTGSVSVCPGVPIPGPSTPPTGVSPSCTVSD